MNEVKPTFEAQNANQTALASKNHYFMLEIEQLPGENVFCFKVEFL